MNEHEFWNRVDELLDARRDPLDDDAVQSHLARHPESLEEYRRLCRTLSALPSRRTARRAFATYAAAALSVAAIVTCVLLVTRTASTPAPWMNVDAQPSVSSAAASTVLDFRLSVVRQTVTLRCTTEIEGDRRTDTREFIAPASSDAPSELRLAHATLTTIQQRGTTP